MPKVIINMELRPCYGEVKRAAQELGVSSTAVYRYTRGEKTALGARLRERIVFKRHHSKGV